MKTKSKAKTTKEVLCELAKGEAVASVDLKFWTVLIQPGGPVVLGEHLYLGTMVMKNHGPGSLMVYTNYAPMDVTLHAGDVRVMPTRHKIQVATASGKPALLEFEYMHAVK
jgi:hypothetical protein